MHSGGGWEIVGRNKKDKNAGKVGKLSKDEKKKFIQNAPKVEDFLPLDQVKKLYDNLDGNKENKKPVKEKESKTKENEEKKKQHKVLQVEKKKVEHPKEKLPNSLEDAVNWINVSEVKNLLATHQTRFPDAPLVWLKTLVAFLNSKIPIEKDDPIFSGRPNNYPLSTLPKSLLNVFEKAIENAGAPNIQLFYEFLLTAMAMEMIKGVPVVGYKIFIQLLATYDPKLSVNNIPKLISMRNSYQNRKPIGLSLLWSFTQGGRENLVVGLKVWHEVLSPMLEAKSYSDYVMRILNDLVWQRNDENLQIDLYLNIFDDFCSGKFNISQPIIDKGILALSKLRCIVFQNKNINYRKLFETVFLKVTLKTPENILNETIEILVHCLISDERCFNVWKSLNMKNTFLSSVILKHIDSNWNLLRVSLNTKILEDVFSTFQLMYEKSKKGKRKDDKYVYSCSNISKQLIQKMLVKIPKTGHFPWKAGCFFVLILIATAITYDAYKQGSFEATSIGTFMRDKGIIAGVQKTLVSIKLVLRKLPEYFETNYPEYYKTVVDFTTPYIKLLGDFYLVGKAVSIKLYGNLLSYGSTTIPIVGKRVEYYIPGLLDSVQQGFLKGIQIVKIYSVFIAEQTIEIYMKAARWLKTNVFIGKLSPDNLQNYANEAITRTHTFASQAYDWMYEKMETLSKVE